MKTLIYAFAFFSFALCGSALCAETDAVTLPAAEVQSVHIDVGSNAVRVVSTLQTNATLVLKKRAWAPFCRVQSVFDGETWSVRVTSRPGCVADFEVRVAPSTAVRHIGGAAACGNIDVLLRAG